MGLNSIHIEKEYRSKHTDVIKNFYIPLLSQANLYCRAVGYFSSGILSSYAVGLKQLVDNGGYIQIVASPSLSNEDIDAIKKGYRLRNEVVQEALLRELAEPKNLYEKECLNLLANYIANGKLDIKIALVGGKKGDGLGIYHEKLGLIFDREDNVVAFSGSNNETLSGVRYNYETLDVYCSWSNEDEQERVNRKVKAFKDIWGNKDQDVEVVDFPYVQEEIIDKYRYSTQINTEIIEQPQLNEECIALEDQQEYRGKIIGIPNSIQLHEYQQEAIVKWEEYGFRGIFDMATGTGKTYTGIAGICRLYDYLNGNLAAVIVCPYQHLVDQWVEDFKVFGIYPIVGYSSSENAGYEKKLKNAVIDFKLGSKKFFCFICTQDTFSNEIKVQVQLKKIRHNLLIVVDEAHNIGSKNALRLLDDSLYDFRLALSATLDRHGDEKGTKALYEFFGNKCIEYTLERAIKEDKLTRYYYYPVLITLTEEELVDYINISKELLNCLQYSLDNYFEMSDAAKKIAIKRARLVARAKNKTNELFRIIKEKEYYLRNHMLIYCGAAKLKSDDELEDVRQIDYVSDELWKRFQMKTAQFTSNEDIRERRIIKSEFADGTNLQAIVAIKCLDEGVNIPEIETAFILASTTNPKEYIQRRGRVLRKCKDKDFAYIYDFITIPRKLDDVPFLSDNDLKYDKSLVKNELKRMIEFQKLAENRTDSLLLSMKLRDVYGLEEEVDF